MKKGKREGDDDGRNIWNNVGRGFGDKLRRLHCVDPHVEVGVPLGIYKTYTPEDACVRGARAFSTRRVS